MKCHSEITMNIIVTSLTSYNNSITSQHLTIKYIYKNTSIRHCCCTLDYRIFYFNLTYRWLSAEDYTSYINASYLKWYIHLLTVYTTEFITLAAYSFRNLCVCPQNDKIYNSYSAVHLIQTLGNLPNLF